MAGGEDTTIKVSADSLGGGGSGGDSLTRVVADMRAMASQVGNLTAELGRVVTALQTTNSAVRDMATLIGGRGAGGGGSGGGASRVDATAVTATPGAGSAPIGVLESMRALNLSLKEFREIAPASFKTVTSSIRSEVKEQQRALREAYEAYADNASPENRAAALDALGRYRYTQGVQASITQQRVQTINTYGNAIATTISAAGLIADAGYITDISKQKQDILNSRIGLAKEYVPYQQAMSNSAQMQRMVQAGMNMDFGYLFAAGATANQQKLITNMANARYTEQDRNIAVMKLESEREKTANQYSMYKSMALGAVGVLAGGALVVGTAGLAAPLVVGGMAAATGAGAFYSVADIMHQKSRTDAAYSESQLRAKEAEQHKKSLDLLKNEARAELTNQNQAMLDPYYLAALNSAIQSAPTIAGFDRRFGFSQSTGGIVSGAVTRNFRGQMVGLGSPLNVLKMAKYEDVASSAQQMGAMFGMPFGATSQFTNRLDEYMRLGVSPAEMARMTNEFAPGRNLAGAVTASDTSFNVAYNSTGSIDTALAAVNAASKLGYGIGGVTGTPKDMTNLVLGLAGGANATAFSIQQAEDTVRSADRFGRSALTTARTFNMLNKTGASMIQAARLTSSSVRELMYGSTELTNLGVNYEMRQTALKARASSLDIMKVAYNAKTEGQQAALLAQVEGFEGLSEVQRKQIVQFMRGKQPSGGGQDVAPSPVAASSAVEAEEAVRTIDMRRQGVSAAILDREGARRAVEIAGDAAVAGGGGKNPVMDVAPDPNQPVNTAALNKSVTDVAAALSGLATKINQLKLR